MNVGPGRSEADGEKLQCRVCYEPLMAPVFQCENGHIACSICCHKINNECPFCCCSEKERASDSAAAVAKYYGCRHVVPLIKNHYKFCPDSYSLCGRPDCVVLASRGHVATTNYSISTVLDFVLNESLQFTLPPDVHNTLVLHEHKHGLQFVLIKSSYHSWVSINRLDSRNSFNIDIEASIFVPAAPGLQLDDEEREMFEAAGIGSTDEEIREHLLANGSEELREYVTTATLGPRWIPMSVDLVKMTNHTSTNKDKVEAHLIQPPYYRDMHDAPFNIQISIKQNNTS